MKLITLLKNNMRNQNINIVVIRKFKNKYLDFRLGDLFIISLYLSGTSLFIIFLKNFMLDSLNSTPSPYSIVAWLRVDHL